MPQYSPAKPKVLFCRAIDIVKFGCMAFIGFRRQLTETLSNSRCFQFNWSRHSSRVKFRMSWLKDLTCQFFEISSKTSQLLRWTVLGHVLHFGSTMLGVCQTIDGPRGNPTTVFDERLFRSHYSNYTTLDGRFRLVTTEIINYLPRIEAETELVFLSLPLRSKLFPNEKKHEELQKMIVDFRKKWQGPSGNFSRFRNSRDIEDLRSSITEIARIEQFIAENTNEKQKSYLRWLVQRRKLLVMGVLDFVQHPDTFDEAFSIEQRQELVEELAKLRVEIIKDGKQLIFDFLDREAPKMVDGISAPLREQINCVPLKILVVLALNPEWCQKNCDQFTIDSDWTIQDLVDGNFLLYPWIVRIGGEGEFEISRRIPMKIGSWKDLVSLSTLDLIGTQFKSLRDLLLEDQPSVQTSDSANNMHITQKYLSDVKETNRLFEDILVQHQLEVFRSAARFNLLFQLGPHVVLEAWQSEHSNNFDRQKLDLAIGSLVDQISDHLRKSEEKIESRIRSSLEKAGIDPEKQNYPFRANQGFVLDADYPWQYELILFGAHSVGRIDNK